MATITLGPSGLDDDPTAYLALPRFNHTLGFDFELPGAETSTASVTYALTDAPLSASLPVLVLFNGLGGHRLIAAMTEGIARSHSVQILTLDKPGAGGSSLGVSIPLATRTRWMHTALLAVLAHHSITRFAVLSHSNGLFYALYTLLHLPPTLTATSWTLSGPFVPPSISGSVALRLAAALPAPLPNALGSILQLVPPVARAVSWSGGLLSMSAGLLSAASPAATGEDGLDERERLKPPHQRRYLHRYVGAAAREAIMQRAMDESRVAMGQEALFSLHGGDAVIVAGGGAGSGGRAEGEGDSVWGLGLGATDADVLRGAFTRLAELHPHDALRIHVVYGAADGMVPVKGRTWLKSVLEDVGLIRSGDEAVWTEVPEAGHDDILFLEDVVGRILQRVDGE
ncbi:hypothetical protein B0H19DRAFT_1274361 [Mycena capillaripes]|nr:hypothetical protein B0H19DRAFT_1274361 [Mycena capillaripes]